MRVRLPMLLIAAAAIADLRAQPHAANSTLTAVNGLKVGHHTLAERPTGCTVVLAEAGAVGGVSVRGAAPATRETDLLDPTKMVQQIYGVVLSGGSTFGLESAGGVLKFLEDRQIGVAFGGLRIPVVPGASIFDLGVGDGKIRPTADCGLRAAQAANANPVQEGSIGAGAGATLGKYLGMERAMKSGVGSAAATLADGTTVAALAVANPLGDVIDPDTGRTIAGVRSQNGNALADVRQLIRSQRARPPGGGNTTIGVIATDARLSKAQANHLAQLADDGYARAIWPVHSIADGDTVFALATGTHAGEPDMLMLGAIAADVMSKAVVRAATQATGLPRLPADRKSVV